MKVKEFILSTVCMLLKVGCQVISVPPSTSQLPLVKYSCTMHKVEYVGLAYRNTKYSLALKPDLRALTAAKLIIEKVASIFDTI